VGQELAQDVVGSEDVDLVRELKLGHGRLEQRVASQDSSIVDDDRRVSNLSHSQYERRAADARTYLRSNSVSYFLDGSGVGDVALVVLDVLCSPTSVLSILGTTWTHWRGTSED
jgi:hypothetical protein